METEASPLDESVWRFDFVRFMWVVRYYKMRFSSSVWEIYQIAHSGTCIQCGGCTQILSP
jgi:hypothetical protein